MHSHAEQAFNAPMAARMRAADAEPDDALSPTLAALRDLVASTPGRPGAELDAARVLLADHARELAGLVHDATRADRDRNPGPGPQSDRNYARRGGMISARQVLDRYADQLDQQAADGGGQPATPTPADPWPTIARLTAWLDHHNGSSTPETTLRILKVQEEAGEVAAAWIGRLGQNPRKGVTHTTSDVADELCDVIVAAMVALTTIVPDPAAHFARKIADIAAVRLDTPGGES